jgi:hypothetical protein
MLDQPVAKEQHAYMAGVNHHTLEGLNPSINQGSSPKKCEDAMSCIYQKEWAEIINKEYL